jgi:hypothetical protein
MDRYREFLEKQSPEVRAEFERIAAEERAIREDMAARKVPTASEAIADTTRTLPFSMRLTGLERSTLAAAAADLGVTRTDLARQFIIEGLQRWSAKRNAKLDPEKASQVVGEIINLLERAGLGEHLLTRETGS